jgi:hypothetical protein
MQLIKKSVNDVIKNPQVILFSILILTFQIIFGVLFFKIIYSSLGGSNLQGYILLISGYIITSLFLSPLLILMIKPFFKQNSAKNLKLFINNFIILFIMILVYNIILKVANFISTNIGMALNLSVDAYKLLLFIIIFSGIIFIMQFLSLSSFFLVKNDSSFLKSIKSSIKFVKFNYIYVLSIFIIFFVFLEMSNRLLNINIFIFTSISEVVNFVIIYPLLASVLANLIKSKSK